jgi:hypothetical protein
MSRPQPATQTQEHSPRRLPMVNGPSFFDTHVIKRGDGAVLGRFFLEAEAALNALGITVHRITMAELYDIFQSNQDSWSVLGPPFHIHETALTDDGAACFVGYDTTGRAICTNAVRYYDLGGESLTSWVRSMRFFYGDNAERVKHKFGLNLTAPMADEIKGRVVNLGAQWVHPDYRHAGINIILGLVMRAFALSEWEYDHEVLCGRGRLGDPDVLAQYHFAHSQETFQIVIDRKVAYDGKLIWTPADLVARIYASGAARRDIAASSRAGNGQQIARA